MTTTATTTATTGTAWTVAPTIPDMSKESKSYTSYSVTNSFISEFGWQLTGNVSDEFDTWLGSNWATQAKADKAYDIRDTSYDVDGYMLVGKAVLNDDPEKSTLASVTYRGYIYMCAKDGATSSGFTCAYIKGDNTEMTAKTYVGTQTSTTLTFADFSAVSATGSTTPKQLDIGITGTGIMKEKACTLDDGANGCWGHKFTYAANKSTYEVYMYMLRQTEKDAAVDSDVGFRYNAGDEVEMGIIMSLSGLVGQQNHVGQKFKLQGATSTLIGYAGFVAGVVATMF